ncbi:MAG: hypothetical protein ACTS3R_03635 [Inquilinaceae bacterium]
MIIGRAIGWALIGLALLVLGHDAWVWADGGPFRLVSGGELWFGLDPGSLNLVQAVTQRYLWPPLWDPGIVTLLLWPASVVLGGLGGLLVLAFQGRGRGRRWR